MPTSHPAPDDGPTSLGHLAAAYADDPGPGTLGALRRAVRSSRGFGSRPRLAAGLAERLRAGDHAAVVRDARAAMPGAFFSHRVHRTLAAAYAGLGDDRRAAREQRIARLALASVLRTGDGTPQRPWSVLHLDDEYDVLASAGRGSDGQRLVRRGDRRFDVHTCGADEVWFDVTASSDAVRRPVGAGGGR